MKSEKYQFRANALYSEHQAERVDAEAGVIYGVVLAQEGLNRNDTYFSERFLNELCAYGNEHVWIKSRFGHPNMCSTSLGSFIGRYKDFVVLDGKLYGDLYLDEIAKSVQVEGRGISMWDYIVKMAQSNSEVFGNSIVITADYVEETYEEDGEEKTAWGHALREWAGSDLVDDPAATDSLFHGVNDFGLLVTDFLDENPQVFEVLDKNPLMLFDFIERYEAYNNRKHNNGGN